ncbi:MAG: cyclic nucleotide-binding domain-containing protein [Xenococcaceae cyanobacterium MO_234.B1]|nr:cyclic nucleotide-binding domain-containing protein [Xenococcaceae cyanobacterium MO_234.B1]
MNRQNLELILKKTKLGAEFSEQELKKLASVAKLQEFASGTFLMNEGNPSDSLMIVIQGKIEVETKKSHHHISQIEATEEGLVIGELGLLLDEPRAASIKALKDCQVLVFSKASLSQFLLNGDSLITTLAIQLGQSLGMKVHVLLDEVVTLFNEHDELLTIIESLRNSHSQADLESLKEDLLKQAENLRKSQQNVQRKLYYLDSEIQHTKTTRRGAEILIALVGGSLVTLMVGWMSSKMLLRLASPNSPLAPAMIPYPTVIPYIETEEACQERLGSHWHNGQCWDYEHPPEW